MKKLRSFGAYVRAARRSREITQAVLAQRVGHTGPWVCGVEHGFVNPSPADQRRLERALGLAPFPRRSAP